jgi:hypothetical protein
LLNYVEANDAVVYSVSDVAVGVSGSRYGQASPVLNFPLGAVERSSSLTIT